MKHRVVGRIFVFVFLFTSFVIQAYPVARVIESQSKAPYDVGGKLESPRLFAEGVVSTTDYERGGTFTPDGSDFYFVKRTPGAYFSAICVTHFSRGKWSHPSIAPFSGQYIDLDPFITHDGSRLYFTSRRPVNGKPKSDLDIWYLDKTVGGWSEPTNLGSPVNTDGNENYPTLTNDGTLYFATFRPGGKGYLDIYRSRFVNGAFSEPENLGEPVNGPASEAYPFIAPDESYLVFTSFGRDDETFGNGHRYVRGDLYISFKVGDTWGTPRHLGVPFTTGAFEGCPFVSPNGKYFFFTSERGPTNLPDRRFSARDYKAVLNSVTNGSGNIYQVGIEVILGSGTAPTSKSSP